MYSSGKWHFWRSLLLPISIPELCCDPKHAEKNRGRLGTSCGDQLGHLVFIFRTNLSLSSLWWLYTCHLILLDMFNLVMFSSVWGFNSQRLKRCFIFLSSWTGIFVWFQRFYHNLSSLILSHGIALCYVVHYGPEYLLSSQKFFKSPFYQN